MDLILVDTSAWVEYLRGTDSPAHVATRTALLGDALATCDAVRMELLAGARSERHARDLNSLLARAVSLDTAATDYEFAASIYRQCRRGGETPRSLIDCLIAAVAIRTGTPVLHTDRDFDMIARHSPLGTVANR